MLKNILRGLIHYLESEKNDVLYYMKQRTNFLFNEHQLLRIDNEEVIGTLDWEDIANHNYDQGRIHTIDEILSFINNKIIKDEFE